MTREGLFQAHLDLLHCFLARRGEIVERIQGLLNARRKPLDYRHDRSVLSAHLEDCFFTLPCIDDDQSRLRGRLEDAHRASGFAPRELPGLHNDLIDPAEMMIRAFHLWEQTRWPGQNGRVRYAHTLFNLFVLRCLELSSLRVWDGDAAGAGARLAQLQRVLDELWEIKTADQPTLVRDARWLIPLAQSPATDNLGAYFDVAALVADSFSEPDRLAIHKAGVVTAGGHLRSQIRYYSLKNAVALDEHRVVLTTRSSNALDFALLIHDLVPLLDAYERAVDGDDPTRLELADAICQGMSPDPELFLNRVDLLSAYSMIEHLFVTTDADGHAAYTPLGARHVRLCQEYAARIGRVATALLDDCPRFRPAAGTYSPYGVLYGFSTNLVEHMAFKTLQPDAVTRFSLEDVFAAGGADKLAWVSSWRKLPHLTREVEAQFDYPQQFAEDVFGRIEQALRTRVSSHDTGPVARTGRLFVFATDDPQDSIAASIPKLPAEYFSSDRSEGRCVLSYETPGGWVAISKAILTDVLGAGRDVKVAELPRSAVAALTLMCPTLVVVPEKTPH